MQSQIHILTLLKTLIIKFLNLKLFILIEYQNLKTSLQRFTLKIGHKNFLWLKMLKIMFCGYML